jgi:hypothetical protein
VGDQDNGSPGRPVSSGLQVPGEPGHCCATRPPWWPSCGVVFFLQNILHLHQNRFVILHVDSSTLWKIINEEDAVFIPKNRVEARTFPVDFCTRNFLGQGWVTMLPLHWLLLCLRVIWVCGHSGMRGNDILTSSQETLLFKSVLDLNQPWGSLGRM